MKKVCIGLIHWYQKMISPHLGKCCRFEPSCSHYAEEAYERFGFFKGSFLTVRRLLRCNPWGGHGYDPVPEKFEDYKKKKNN